LISLFDAAVWVSSLSFVGYGITYFTSPHMKEEFVRFGLPGLGTLTAVFQIMGAAGLIAGFRFPILLVLASGGLALMMLLGLAVRLKVNDSLWVSLPALFYFVLNSGIFVAALRAHPEG
jgi:hypothetical protein